MDDFPRSTAAAGRLIARASSPSTNAELAALASGESAEDLPDMTVLVTRDQTAGRGRLGRTWVAPAGASLAISVLVRRPMPVEALGWLPIAAGVAMTGAVAALLPGSDVGFKWPNDVLIDGRKVCGILAELLPDGESVVIGAGLNTTMEGASLPVPTATSLALAGAIVDPEIEDAVLATYLTRLGSLLDGFVTAHGDAEASGLRADAVALCRTIGRRVRLELPAAAVLEGDATGIDVDGRLEVVDAAGRVHAVAAGDVTHVR